MDLVRSVPAAHGGFLGDSLSCSHSRGSSLTLHPLFPTIFHFLCRRRGQRSHTHTHLFSSQLPFCSKRDQNQVPKLTVSRDEAKKKKIIIKSLFNRSVTEEQLYLSPSTHKRIPNILRPVNTPSSQQTEEKKPNIHCLLSVFA